MVVVVVMVAVVAVVVMVVVVAVVVSSGRSGSSSTCSSVITVVTWTGIAPPFRRPAIHVHQQGALLGAVDRRHPGQGTEGRQALC